MSASESHVRPTSEPGGIIRVLEDPMKIRKTAMITLAIAAAAITILSLTTGSGTAAAQQEDAALEEFIPSEELPADGAVAFPVDI